MARRLLGTATTNSQGIATLIYTGTGVGIMDIVAESNGVTSDSIEVTDCLFFNHSSEWFNASGRLTRTDNDDGSVTLTNNTSSNGFYLANQIGTSKANYADVSEWQPGTCIEFDIISTTDNTNIIQLNDYNNNISSTKQLNTIGATANTHVQITVAADGAVQYLVDGSTYNALAQPHSFAVGFRVNPGKSLTFKDFKIYLI